eukprot:604070-Prymnesium_polylepis.1
MRRNAKPATTFPPAAPLPLPRPAATTMAPETASRMATANRSESRSWPTATAITADHTGVVGWTHVAIRAPAFCVPRFANTWLIISSRPSIENEATSADETDGAVAALPRAYVAMTSSSGAAATKRQNENVMLLIGASIIACF